MLKAVCLSTLIAMGSVAFAETPQVTFHKDVLPVLQKNCQECHRPGEIAPMSLLTYEQTRPWAKAIKGAVVARKMPPWFADPEFGHFANDRRLSEADIRTLTAWADAGAPEGNANDAPAPIKFNEGWNIKPDIIVEMPKAFELPASGTINYKYILVKTDFPTDMWIEAAEMRAGNGKVLHHGKVWTRPPGSQWMANAVPGEAYENETQSDIIGRGGESDGRDILGKFNPGLGAQNFNIKEVGGSAKFVPKGSDLVFELHYTTTGKPTTDISKIGLVLSKNPPQQRYFLATAPMAGNLVIPAGDGNAEVVGEVTTAAPASLVYVQPHMHLRGKDYEIRLIYPTGEAQTIFRGQFDFNWQQGFTFAKPIVLPVGTRILGISHFDNSPNNRFNPDPKKEVRWGPQNWDEMSNAFLGLLFDAKTPQKSVLQRSGPSLLRPVPGQAGPTLATALASRSEE